MDEDASVPTWEYSWQPLEWHSGWKRWDKDHMSRIAELGRSGLEMVSATPDASGNSRSFMLFFKRRLT